MMPRPWRFIEMNFICLKLFNGLKQRSIQTLVTLTAFIFLADYLPMEIHQLFYTISLLIKDVLILLMPLTVGFFIANTVTSFERRAPLFIVLLLIFEAFSNFSSVWYAYFSAYFAVKHIPACDPITLQIDFAPLWRLSFSNHTWWSSEKGSFIGLLLGCIAALHHSLLLKRVIRQGKDILEWILTRIFARLIPLFVLGFAAHLYQTNLLNQVVAHYAVLALWLTSFLLLYLLFLFILGTGFSYQRVLLSIKNLLPAWGIALLSGCSLSTMPLTIEGASKNLQNPAFAKAIIPATTNIQQIGDCIANAFLCFLIYSHFYGTNPDVMTWLNFSVIFVLARFATAAVLGGAIFIMLPIYESYLSFNAEMMAIILALNVILDPLITSCNVMANGALSRGFERVWLYTQKKLGLNERLYSENIL